MREGLREIPDLPLGLRVVLLGKKANVVPDRKKTFEQKTGVLHTPHLDVSID
jgi:hypothetical protein